MDFLDSKMSASQSMVNNDLKTGTTLPFHENLGALGRVAIDRPVVVAVVVAHGDAEPPVVCPHL